ncbi:glutathione S-transferase family protein [Paenirhodobacter sp.]|uniref:glutathione S-transferase family protein n=1 Tax=Paenirhodobacter sp. TaxID=1965326 RepID=UPI003B50FA3B
MTGLKLYTHPKSRGRIARWMLEETGRPYETEVMDYGAPLQSAAFRALNPMGKVPVLVAEGQVVTETAAICAFLAEACPEAGLAPLPSERANYLRWMFFAAGPLEQAISARMFGFEPSAEQRRSVGFGDYDSTVIALAGWLTDHDHVTGVRFTAADVYVGSQVMFALSFGGLPAHPAFLAYRERLAARPAFRRASELDGPM